MSTDYRFSKRIHVSEVLDGRLERFGIRHVTDVARMQLSLEGDTKMLAEALGSKLFSRLNTLQAYASELLTDGLNSLHVFSGRRGYINFVTRFASGGDPTKILDAICEAFDADIYTEHEPQFWGFETQEEWDAWQSGALKLLRI